MRTIIPILEKACAENYPYGGLRTKMYFWVEFKRNRGFRGVTQSVNPKTGQLNKEKFGTYNDLMWIELNEDNHYEFHSRRISGFESINQISEFLSDVYSTNPITTIYDKLGITKEMNQWLLHKILNALAISCAYGGVKKEEVKDVIKVLEGGFKAGNIYSELKITDDILNKNKSIRIFNER